MVESQPSKFESDSIGESQIALFRSEGVGYCAGVA